MTIQASLPRSKVNNEATRRRSNYYLFINHTEAAIPYLWSPMLFRILLWAFILVMIFRFIVRFVFPILNIARATQDKLRHMQQQMEDMQKQQAPPQAKTGQVREGDYIEYEEVK